MTPEKYETILNTWADEERALAAQANQDGDERMHSIHLMKASMMGDMLKVLGRIELSGKHGTLEGTAARCDAEAQKMQAKEDFDAAERARFKAETIRRALHLIENGDE